MPKSRQILGGNYKITPQILGTSVTASNTAAAAASDSCTITGVAGLTTYLTGFSVVSHAPGAVVGTSATPVTITGLIGGTLNFHFVENTTFGGELNTVFPEPIPASAAHINIVVPVPAITSGAVTAVAAYGFQL